jgi:hypothetical protein
VEAREKEANRNLKGITSNYISVVFEGEASLKNTFVDVTVDRWLHGRTVEGTLDFTATSP